MGERRGLLTWCLSIDLTRLLHKGELGKSTGRQHRRGKSRDKGTIVRTLCDLTLLGCDISSCLDLLIGYPQAAFGAEAVSLEIRQFGLSRPGQDVAIRSADW